jgi:phosphonate transport system permease protein
MTDVPRPAAETARLEPYLRPDLSRQAFNWMVLGVTGVLLAVSFAPAEMFKAVSLVTDFENMVEYASGFLTPDFHRWEIYTEQMVITAQIALWGTVLAIVFGIPFGLLSSENIAPVWIVQPVRRLMDAARAINELVCWRWPYTTSASSPSCSPRPWRRSTRARSRASARPAPGACQRSSTA